MTVLLLLAGCVPGWDSSGATVTENAQIIEVSVQNTLDPSTGIADEDYCYEAVRSGHDYTSCCPPGWAPLALSPSGVLCVQR